MSIPESNTQSDIPDIPESPSVVEPEGDIMLEPDPEIVVRIDELTRHQHQREIRYGKIENELDMLYKDIDAGLFGEAAKTGSFYLHIKTIKDDVPKITDERKAVVEAELEAIFANQGEGD